MLPQKESLKSVIFYIALLSIYGTLLYFTFVLIFTEFFPSLIQSISRNVHGAKFYVEPYCVYFLMFFSHLKRSQVKIINYKIIPYRKESGLIICNFDFKIATQKKLIFGSLQTILLGIVGELAGGRSSALAVALGGRQ